MSLRLKIELEVTTNRVLTFTIYPLAWRWKSYRSNGILSLDVGPFHLLLADYNKVFASAVKELVSDLQKEKVFEEVNSGEESYVLENQTKQNSTLH